MESDTRALTFEESSHLYRLALARAQRAENRLKRKTSEKTLRDVAEADRALDAARLALHEASRKVAHNPLRTKAKDALGLTHRGRRR